MGTTQPRRRLVRRGGGLCTVDLARPSLPTPRPLRGRVPRPSAEAALGAGFDLERRLRAVRGSARDYHADLAQRFADEATQIPRRAATLARFNEREKQVTREHDRAHLEMGQRAPE